jgi:hypothetical protein
MIETQMAVKAKQVSELETQAEYLQRTAPEKMDEIQMKKTQVEIRFEQLKAPLLDRQRQLEKKKEAFQVGSCYFVVVVLNYCFQIVGCDTIRFACYGSACCLLQDSAECCMMSQLGRRKSEHLIRLNNV